MKEEGQEGEGHGRGTLERGVEGSMGDKHERGVKGEGLKKIGKGTWFGRGAMGRGPKSRGK